MSVSNPTLYKSIFAPWLANMNAARKARLAGDAGLAAKRQCAAAEARRGLHGSTIAARARAGVPALSRMEAQLLQQRALTHAVRFS
jgi:hypothetical protein